jgi:hypothetical protein
MYQYYQSDNSVTKVQRIKENSVAVADETGTIRLFEVPTYTKGFYQVYSDHLSYISILVSSKNLLVSASLLDK